MTTMDLDTIAVCKARLQAQLNNFGLSPEAEDRIYDQLADLRVMELTAQGIFTVDDTEVPF